MAESIAFEPILPTEDAPSATIDAHASGVASRMFAAFLAAFCAATSRIAPGAYRVTFGPGKTPRVTLDTLETAHVSDGRAWFHVSAGRSSSARREGYVRACIAQAALVLATGDRTMASLAMEAHGAERPAGAKPEQWAYAIADAEGPIGAAYAALVTAQGDYVFPHGNKPRKTGKTAHRWIAFYTTSEGKTGKLTLPAEWVPDPSRDGTSTVADDAEFPSTLALFGIDHPVTVKRVIVRK